MQFVIVEPVIERHKKLFKNGFLKFFYKMESVGLIAVVEKPLTSKSGGQDFVLINLDE